MRIDEDHFTRDFVCLWAYDVGPLEADRCWDRVWSFVIESVDKHGSTVAAVKLEFVAGSASVSLRMISTTGTVLKPGISVYFLNVPIEARDDGRFVSDVLNSLRKSSRRRPLSELVGCTFSICDLDIDANENAPALSVDAGGCLVEVTA